MHYVRNTAEIMTGFAVAVDIDRLAFDQAGNPPGHDSDVGAFRVLAGAEHIEVAQANGAEAIAARKHFSIQLVYIFDNGVGAQRLANGIFRLGQAGVVAIGAAASGVGEAFNLGVTRSHQHVDKAGDVGGVGGDGLLQAARHAAQPGLVQHVVNALAGTLAVGQLADVALDEAEVGPLRGGDEGLHFIQVALVAGVKVVQPHHGLIALEQGFQQVAANEAGRAGHKPDARGGAQLGLQGLVGSGLLHFC